MVRLQKYLALCGVASRRKAEDLIKTGRVKVNGKTITTMGVLVDEKEDIIFLDEKKLELETKKRYVILNKPKGYVTTSEDQFDRATVMDLVSEIEERIYPVGRLDYDTEGLLLLTNDGDFAYKIAHPKGEINKVYIAKIAGVFNQEKAEKLKKGVIVDGKITSESKVELISEDKKYKVVKITIHEGRNRQVKKMFEAVGCKVLELKRTSVGRFSLGNIPLGKWREFTKAEMEYVQKYKREG